MAPLVAPPDLSSLGVFPTKTISRAPAELRVRQAPVATVTVMSDAGNGTTTLSGGAIAGIVIGSIAGFLLLAWILRSCMNLGAPPQERDNWYHDSEPPPRRSHSAQRGHHHHHHHRRSHPEVTTVHATPVVVRDDRRRSSRDHSVRASRSPRRPDDVYVYDSTGRARGSGKYYSSY